MLKGCRGNDFRLNDVAALFTGIEDLRDMVKPQPHAGFGRLVPRNHEEFAFIELPISDSNERLVFALVMPAEHVHRQAPCGEKAGDVFGVGDAAASSLVLIGGPCHPC